MEEEVSNVLLQSQLHDPSTDELHQSLRLLVRKIRAQLEVLTKKNKLKEEENLLLETEISNLKKDIINYETIITTKTSVETKLNNEICKYKLQIENELSQNNLIKSQLLSQINQLKNDKNEIINKHKKELNEINNINSIKLREEETNFENLRKQKLLLDVKLQEIQNNNDELYKKVQTAKSEKNCENKNELEKLKKENINYLTNIQQLKNKINEKDKQINEMGMSVISMQNDINHLQNKTKNDSNDHKIYENKLNESQKQIDHYKNQYQQLLNTMDKIIDASKQIDDEPFWPINNAENKEEIDKKNDNDNIIIETVAHPYPTTPTSISIEMDNHKRLLEIQMFPKRIIKLQKELKDAQSKLIIEKENNSQVNTYWKNKIKEINTKNTDLNQRMENLERMVDDLSSTNTSLLKENDSLKAEMHNNKFTSSAHEIFLQMKTKEETQKTLELQREVDVLQDDLCRKNALISKLEKSNRLTKESIIQQKKLHQTEMQQLTNKLHLLTQLSQEEIKQTVHLTIHELQSIFDQYGPHNIESTEMDLNDENKIDLSPKMKPHITDSDIGDNDDDVDIIEAEDKLASYFARHKQRQLVTVEPIAEANEDDITDTKPPQIVDDDNIEADEDENILTPPLQEEAPYIVDDTLSMDRPISNVSISNVANSNCSTRGNSTRGDQSPISKIDEPPTKGDINIINDNIDDDDDDVDDSKEIKDINDENKQNNAPQIVDVEDDVENDELESKTANAQDVPEEKSDSRILHSLQTFLSTSTQNTDRNNTTINQSLIPQPLQTRARSMGSIITTGDDVMSVDQSMLAHDGSRDGSVVPEQTVEIFVDDNDNDNEITQLSPEDMSNTNNIFGSTEYIATPEIADTEIISVDRGVDISVDDIHLEAHELIDELHQNLKDLEKENNNEQTIDIPMIVQENESIDNQITNNDILQPLIQRQTQHIHSNEQIEKQKKLLSNAKAKWSAKVEEMIANTDQWFINEDGDIVMIYPEADNIENKHNKIDNKNDEITKMIVENVNVKTNVKENNDNIENKNIDNAEENNNKNVIENKQENNIQIDAVENEQETVINDVNDKDNDKKEEEIVDERNELNVNESNTENINDNNNNNNNDIDNSNDNIKKNENFFNSFRIF